MQTNSFANRHIYVYDHSSYNSDWRVYQGLLLKAGDKKSLILFVDELQLIHIEELEHLSVRIGAACFVRSDEFNSLADDIEKDWNARHLWKEAYDDIQFFKRNIKF